MICKIPYESEKHLVKNLYYKNIDETKNYFLEEIEQNELISRKHKKVCTTLNYINYFLVLAFVGIPIGLSNLAIELKTCAKATGIKNIIQ